MKKLLASLILLLAGLVPGWSIAQVISVLAPDRPTVDVKGGKPAGKSEKSQNEIPEIDILMALTDPYAYQGVNMDMPMSLAEIFFDPDASDNQDGFSRRDLIGDAEEIRYLDKRSWGVNVALEKPGLYQYIMEAKPRWDESLQKYKQDFAKIIVPVLGQEKGWNLPAGLNFEILPLSRPFGLTAPCQFRGQTIVGNKPAAGIKVEMGWINDARVKVQSAWHERMAAVSDAEGYFSFVLAHPGWWFCEATIEGDPLKGIDGEMKSTEISTILWFYVEPQEKPKR